MEHAATTNDGHDAMRQETRDQLMLLVYHPRHSSDPDRMLRHVQSFLARPDLTHAMLMSIRESEALRLIDELRRSFPDRTEDVVARVTQELMGRPE